MRQTARGQGCGTGGEMTGAGAAGAKSLVGAVLLVVACVVAGALGGVVVTTRILPTGGMGWDQLADFLAGAVFGAGGGLLAGLVLAWRLPARARAPGAVLAVLAGVAAFVYLTVTPPNMNSGPRAAPPPPAVEPFSLTLGTADPQEGPRQDDPLLPWSILRTDSGLTLSYVLPAAPDQLCVAPEAMASTAGIETARGLRALLEQLPAALACAPACPTCTEVSLEWFLDGERRTLSFDDRCWREDAALRPAREALHAIYAGHDRAGALCETLVQ